MKVKIFKDKILNIWTIWEVHQNYEVMLYKAKTKKACNEWLKTHKKKDYRR